MAGHFQQAGRRIVRRATAAGLGALAVSVLVGALSLALTTTYAGHASEDVAAYMPTDGRIAELRNLSAVRPRVILASRVVASPNEQAMMFDRGAEPAVPDDNGPVVAAPAIETSIAAMAVAPEPIVVPGDRVQATVSFYYCEPGARGLHPGDGGGFCGVMRNGQGVFPGAAACAYQYLGQRFRIESDPTERVYVCADTGNAVAGMHRDIWFMDSDEGWAWQMDVGQVAMIEILP